MASFFDLKARKAAAANGTGAPKSEEAKQAARKQPWVEKYRPKTLNDVTAQDHTVNVLQRTLQASNLPHMLFYGPPGTGKTSTILALAKELYGPEMMKSRVLELNASDERGISIVREKVKDFARMQLTNPPAGYRAAGRYPCPPFKIIILDEADSMTQDAQSALRRTMETYSKITRFCLICNYVTRIIDPLASRCSKFRFKSLDQGNARRRLEDIAAKEGVELENGAVDTLIRCSEGDLRKAITFLQSAARLVGATEKDGVGNTAAKEEEENDDDDDDDDDDDADKMDVDGGAAAGRTQIVSVKIVQDIAGVIPDRTIESLQKAMQPRSAGATYQAIAKVVEELVADGWSAGQVISQLYQAVIHDEMVSDLSKNKITLVFSEIDKRLVDGADEHLSVLDLALRISNILAGKG
ncbi:putative replication factor protein [Xylariomycetidae sp. FL2044]|nr:putative replication factor protein [Xylariomycetidae sp. FL2044]